MLLTWRLHRERGKGGSLEPAMPHFPWTPTNTSWFDTVRKVSAAICTEHPRCTQQGRLPSRLQNSWPRSPWPPGMWLGGNTWKQPRGAAENALQVPGQGQHTWRVCWTAGCRRRVIYGSLQMAGSSHRASDQNPGACCFLKGGSSAAALQTSCKVNCFGILSADPSSILLSLLNL